jgi:nucleoside-diphosphate-sugar epimerase
LEGVTAIAHVASTLTFDPNPNKVIPEVLGGINGILKSAAASPSVKRFVYTSSSTAATAAIPNKKFDITTDTWNETDIKAAWAPPPYEDSRKWSVYASSKAEAEKALWEFVKEQKPHFVCNAILPNTNFGKILLKGQPASTGNWIVNLYKGNVEALQGIPPRTNPHP